MPTDLHSRLVEAITARLNLAEAALAERDSDWWWGPDAESAAERHIAANSPAFVAGACRADLGLLDQHRMAEPNTVAPVGEVGRAVASGGGVCVGHGLIVGEVDAIWPCAIVRNRAVVYGVNLDEQEG